MLRCMRTTLTLDDDVAARLESLRISRNVSLKDLVNEALREGLRVMDSPPPERPAFETASVDLGRCRIQNVDNVAEALAIADGEAFR